jgi:hypothetical protein
LNLQGRFGLFVSALEILFPSNVDFGFEETGWSAMSVRAAPSPTALSPRAEHPDLLQARPAEACRVASHDGDDSAIVTTLPEEEQLMPLSRLNEGFEIELEGIAFGMVDRQGHRWRCLITDRVLSDAIGGAPTQKDKTAWFRANRSSVERVASSKFDMGAFEKDGFISITHWRRRG